MKRIDWIDFGKFFAIFLVVWCHTPLPENIEAIIYYIHVPFFFFISGYLFSFDKHKDFRSFVCCRFKQLLVPYILLNIVSYLFWFLVAKNFGDDALHPVAWYRPIVGAILGYPIEMVHDRPLWFIYVLFVMELIFFSVKRISSHKYLIVLFGCIAFLFQFLLPIRLPFALDIACMGLVFYTLGYQIKSKIDYFLGLKSFLLSIVAIGCIAMINGKGAMHITDYNNILLYIVGCFSGIVFLLNLSHYLSHILRKNQLILYIGRHTLLICGIHLLLFTLIKGVLVYILDISPSILQDTVFYNFLFVLVCLVLCIPCCLAVDFLKVKIKQRKS